jgi:hypothetical protein
LALETWPIRTGLTLDRILGGATLCWLGFTISGIATSLVVTGVVVFQAADAVV